MGLSSQLAQQMKSALSDDQGKWRQYIVDHLDYIAARSTTYNIEPSVMEQYRYDLDRFLKEKLTRHEDLGWIVLYLNSMPNDLLFVDVKKIVVPSDSLIQSMYLNYLAVSANAQ